MGDVRLGEMVLHGGSTVIIVFPVILTLQFLLRVQGRDKYISFQQLIHLLFTLRCGTTN